MAERGAGKRIGIRLAILLAVAGLFFLLYRPILLIFGPFVLAFFLARAMEPLLHRLAGERTGLRRVLSIVLVTLVFLVALGLIGWLAVRLVYELRDLSGQWSGILAQFHDYGVRVIRRLGRRSNNGQLTLRSTALLESLVESLNGVLGDLLRRLASRATAWVRYLPQALMFLLVLAMGACVMSQDFPQRRARYNERLSAQRYQTSRHVLQVFRAAFGGYLLRGVIRSAGVMLLCLVGFSILHLRYTAVLAITLGILDFLPYVGAGTVLLPWAVYRFTLGDWGTGLLLLAVYAATVLQRVAVRRRGAGGRNIGAFAELCCVFVGWKFWGILGILLGPVLARIVRNLYHAGVFDGTLRDCRMLYRQIVAKLSRSQ